MLKGLIFMKYTWCANPAANGRDVTKLAIRDVNSVLFGRNYNLNHDYH